MSVYIHDPNALDRLCVVEGEDYRTEQVRYEAMGGHYRAQSFVGWRESAARERDDGRAGVPIYHHDSGALYGHHGWHRYVVLTTGELLFHEGFTTSPEATDRADAVGFRLFWRDHCAAGGR